MLVDDAAAGDISAVRAECRDALRQRVPTLRLREDLLLAGYEERVVNEALSEYSWKLESAVASDNLSWRGVGGFTLVVGGTLAAIMLFFLPDKIVIHFPLIAAALWGLCVLCDPRWTKITGRGRFT